MFTSISVSLDMGGCNKKCKFCRYSKQTKASLTIDDLHLVYELISPFTDNLLISSFYKEIDVFENYKEIYEIENKLNNNINKERLNKINIERLLKDEKYLTFLKKQNVHNVIIDVYGNRTNHDYFVGRTGSFNQILNMLKAYSMARSFMQ